MSKEILSKSQIYTLAGKVGSGNECMTFEEVNNEFGSILEQITIPENNSQLVAENDYELKRIEEYTLYVRFREGVESIQVNCLESGSKLFTSDGSIKVKKDDQVSYTTTYQNNYYWCLQSMSDPKNSDHSYYDSDTFTMSEDFTIMPYSCKQQTPEEQLQEIMKGAKFEVVAYTDKDNKNELSQPAIQIWVKGYAPELIKYSNEFSIMCEVDINNDDWTSGGMPTLSKNDLINGIPKVAHDSFIYSDNITEGKPWTILLSSGSAFTNDVEYKGNIRVIYTDDESEARNWGII